MTGHIALLGGGEHQHGCERIDRRLLAESGVGRPTVVVLVAATVRRHVGAKIAEASTYWRRLGATTRFAFATERSGTDDALTALRDPDLVVLTGGRPWLLHRRLTAPIVRRLHQLHIDGVPLAGSSAGAMALASVRLHVEPGRVPSLLPGLGLVAGAAAPHYGRHRTPGIVELVARRHPRLTILGLPDRTALVGSDGHFDVMGAGECTVVRGDSTRRYPPGATVVLPGPRGHAGAAAPDDRRPTGALVGVASAR